MHGLTTAEYQTVRAILDLPRSAERERIAASGIPSSTYTAARRRVFEEGWLSDIIVPNPGPWGLAGVDVRLARPSIADRSALRAKWEADPECVLLWEGIHSVLGVFFRRATESSGPPNEPPGPAEWKDAFLVSPRRTEGGIPVFFDYSGLWDRFGGSGPSPSYPAGLDLSAPVASRRLIAAAIELVEEHGGPAPGTAHRLPILRSSPRHLEAMENRVVELRTILDPAKVPPFGGHRLGEVILVQGTLRNSSSAKQLLAGLTSRCGVYPFLLVEARRRVLLGGIGQTLGEGPGRIPVAAARASVSAMLIEHLDPAEVLLEPVEALVPVVHHRYGPRRPSRPTTGGE